MRIVHVADSFAPDIGGIERQVAALVRQQMADGHDVSVVTAVAEPATLDSDLDVHRAARGRWLTVAFPWRNRRMVHDMLDSRPVDVVHAHISVISPLAFFLMRQATRRRLPIAVTAHSLLWRFTPATRLSHVGFGWGRIKASWSGVSTVAAARVHRTFPFAGDVAVVPNLIDSSWWQTGPHDRVSPADVVCVTVVGRLKRRKHIDEFLDVLAQVRARVPAAAKVAVAIVGAGPRQQDLEHQIDRLGLGDWVSLLGYRDPAAVRDLHHESHLFVAPSRQESFGMAAFEARSAGLPVLAYRSNGISDYITDSIDGILVDGQADLADELIELITHPTKLVALLDRAGTTRPPITPEGAMRAVYALYDTARKGHERVRQRRREPGHI